MRFKTLWSEPLGMLLASGSPGSALAYQLGVANAEALMLRRSIATSGDPQASTESTEPAVGDPSVHPARTVR